MRCRCFFFWFFFENTCLTLVLILVGVFEVTYIIDRNFLILFEKDFRRKFIHFTTNVTAASYDVCSTILSLVEEP